MYQHLYSLQQQWSNFPLGLGKKKKKKKGALISYPSQTIDATPQHASLKHCTLQWAACICAGVCVWLATELSLSSPFIDLVRSSVWKLPVINLDYHVNNVNTLVVKMHCCQQTISFPLRQWRMLEGTKGKRVYLNVWLTLTQLWVWIIFITKHVIMNIYPHQAISQRNGVSRWFRFLLALELVRGGFLEIGCQLGQVLI